MSAVMSAENTLGSPTRLTPPNMHCDANVEDFGDTQTESQGTDLTQDRPPFQDRMPGSLDTLAPDAYSSKEHHAVASGFLTDELTDGVDSSDDVEDGDVDSGESRNFSGRNVDGFQPSFYRPKGRNDNGTSGPRKKPPNPKKPKEPKKPVGEDSEGSQAEDPKKPKDDPKEPTKKSLPPSDM